MHGSRCGNPFLYFQDEDRALIEPARMAGGTYQPKTWSLAPATSIRFGGPQPLPFLLAGYPNDVPAPGPSSCAAASGRTAATGA